MLLVFKPSWQMEEAMTPLSISPDLSIAKPSNANLVEEPK